MTHSWKYSTNFILDEYFQQMLSCALQVVWPHHTQSLSEPAFLHVPEGRLSLKAVRAAFLHHLDKFVLLLCSFSNPSLWCNMCCKDLWNKQLKLCGWHYWPTLPALYVPSASLTRVFVFHLFEQCIVTQLKCSMGKSSKSQLQTEVANCMYVYQKGKKRSLSLHDIFRIRMLKIGRFAICRCSGPTFY